MSSERIDQLLRETFADRHLSRAERRSLREALEDVADDRHDLNHARNLAFALAFETASSERDRQLIDWLHDVVRVIDGRRENTSPCGDSEAIFSPGLACVSRLTALIHSTRRSLDCCVYTITDNRITRELVDAHRRGVEVRIITEDSKGTDEGSDIQTLERRGIPVVDDRAPSLMHHKFAIFDGVTVATGSYNWTRSASDSNQENLVVSSDPGLVRSFSAEFERLWRSFGGSR